MAYDKMMEKRIEAAYDLDEEKAYRRIGELMIEKIAYDMGYQKAISDIRDGKV